MEKIWNYIHYTVFNLYVKIYNLLSYIDPFILIYKIPAVKKFYEKGGINDMSKFTDEIIFNNKVSGLHSIWAGIHMGGLIILTEYGLFNIFQFLVGKSLIQYIWEPGHFYKWIFVAALLIIPWILNERLLFKDDKYLKYFVEFDKYPRPLKFRWTLISLGIILGIIIFFIVSFIPLSTVY